MSLDDTAENCILPAYPGSSYRPAAVNYMDSLSAVVACGGGELADSSKCWAYDGSSWTPLPDSNQQHCTTDSPNAIVGQGWWLTGELQSDSGCSNEWSSEIFIGDAWVQGPQHPNNLSRYSCLVNMNSSHTLYTGGNPTFTESWLYNWTAGVWTKMGELIGRFKHGCVVLEGQGVLVAGGSNGINSDVYSVELYDPETGIWTTQPSLPGAIDPYDLLLLNWEESILALFKDEEQVYQRGEDGYWLALQGVLLPEPFDGFDDKAAMVPADFANGCM